MGEGETSMTADWIAIRELTARYNRTVDDGDVEGFAALFTEDATVVFSSSRGDTVLEGKGAIGKIADRPAGKQVHVSADAIVDVSGDRATQVCTLVLLKPGEDGMTVTSGRYTDELVRTADGWRFSHRTAHLG